MSSLSDAGTDDEFASKSDAFLKWFQAQNGTRLSSKIRLADLRAQGAGRGVVSIADIEEDEELFGVPSSLVLSARSSAFGHYLQTRDKPSTPGAEPIRSWDALTLVIIHEYLRKEASPWYPYLQCLPTSLDTLVYWKEAELDELKGSAVVLKVGRHEADNAFMSRLAPLIRSHEDSFPRPSSLSSWEAPESRQHILTLSHMAGSLIMAYAFDIDIDNNDNADEPDEDGFFTDDEDEPNKGMIPMADMLNADADRNNARLFQEDDYFIMKATKAIKAGEEVLNDYGPLPRSDLLRRYGYITDRYAQYDVVEVFLDMICKVAGHPSTESQSVKAQLASLDELGLLEDGYIFTRPLPGESLSDVIPTELGMLIRTLCRDADASNKRTASEGLTIIAAGVLQAVITKRLADYKTTVAEDGKILTTLATAPTNEAGKRADGIDLKRLEMAVQVRQGEKQILLRLQEMLADHIRLKTNELSSQPSKRKRGGDHEQPFKKARSTA